jgi:hypothetical protein
LLQAFPSALSEAIHAFSCVEPSRKPDLYVALSASSCSRGDKQVTLSLTAIPRGSIPTTSKRSRTSFEKTSEEK